MPASSLMPKADAAVSIDLHRTVSDRAPARTFGDQRPQRAAAGGKPTAARGPRGAVVCVNTTAPHTPLAAARVAIVSTRVGERVLKSALRDEQVNASGIALR
jgi:hypothetical protein